MDGTDHICTIRTPTRDIQAISLIEDRFMPRVIRVRGAPDPREDHTITTDVDRPRWEPEACHRHPRVHMSFLAVGVIDRQSAPASTLAASRNGVGGVVVEEPG